MPLSFLSSGKCAGGSITNAGGIGFEERLFEIEGTGTGKKYTAFL